MVWSDIGSKPTEYVSHGKTSLTEALTGKITLTHSEELKRGITIRLGYADITIYRCEKNHFITTQKCPIDFTDAQPIRTVSIIDAPGHETLMATVLTGASLMDGAILVISANEKCPQPQTKEHLIALEVVGIKNVIIVQNKIDLVSEERAMQSYNEIKNFVKGTILENAPIIPVSAIQRINIDSLLEAIDNFIPTPKRDLTKDPRMLVARSFDVNRPGTEIEKLKGGILGGSIVRGKLKIGDTIEIKPGIRISSKNKSLSTKVTGLQKAGKDLEEAGPGGLLGVMTTLDPYLTKSDSLTGNLVGLPSKLPQSVESLALEIKLLQRVVGSEELKSVLPIKINEDLLINSGTARSIGSVTSIKREKTEMKLKIPICVEQGDRIVISRLIAGRWRLIGYGNVI